MVTLPRKGEKENEHDHLNKGYERKTKKKRKKVTPNKTTTI
jgi:hypothetical protein